MPNPPGPGRPLSVAVVDNHDAVRHSVVAELARHPDRFVPLGAHAGVEHLPGPPARAADVVVLDLHLGRDDTLSTPAVPRLVAAGSAVVLYTSQERPVPLREAVAAGVSGLALKNDGLEALLRCIEQVAAGEFVCSSVLARALATDPAVAPQLTARQVETLECLADGLTRAQAARRMGITIDTVGDYLKEVREKYHALGRRVTNSHSLVREATKDGYLD